MMRLTCSLFRSRRHWLVPVGLISLCITILVFSRSSQDVAVKQTRQEAGPVATSMQPVQNESVLQASMEPLKNVSKETSLGGSPSVQVMPPVVEASEKQQETAMQPTKPGTSASLVSVNGTSSVMDADSARSFHGMTLKNIARAPVPPYLRAWKNPCWEEESGLGSKKLACLPYVYLAGVPKCATTDLFDLLLQHPSVLMPKIKELQYWSSGLVMINQTMGEYVQKLSRPIMTMQQQCNPSMPCNYITIDGTPGTLWRNDYWRTVPGNEGLEEPVIITQHLIHRYTPQAKFIVILRDPVERIYSEYLYTRPAAETSPSNFHRTITQAIDVFHKCLEVNPRRACMYDLANDRRMGAARLPVGIYQFYFEEWFKVFPRDNFFITSLEKYKPDRLATLNEIRTFLGLGSYSWQVSPQRVKNQRQLSAKRAGDMLPETRTLLRDFYRPYNEKLAVFLNDTSYNYPY